MSKFIGITFPLYGFRQVPYDVKYTINTIRVKLNEKSDYKLLDDKTIKDEIYFNRLIKISDIKRIEFHITALNLEQLLNSDLKWGIDSKGKIHNLQRKEVFKLSCCKILRFRQDNFWVKGISYPFKIPEHFTDTERLKKLYVYMIYIDKTWYVYKFSSLYTYNNEIKI